MENAADNLVKNLFPIPQIPQEETPENIDVQKLPAKEVSATFDTIDMEHLPSVDKLGAHSDDNLIEQIRRAEALTAFKDNVEANEKALKQEFVERQINQIAEKSANFLDVITAIDQRVIKSIVGTDPVPDHDLHVILIYTDSSNQAAEGRMTTDHLMELIEPQLKELSDRKVYHRVSHFSFSNTFRYYLNKGGYEIDVKLMGGSQNMTFIKNGFVNIAKAMVGQGRELARSIKNKVLGNNKFYDHIRFDPKPYSKPLPPKA